MWAVVGLGNPGKRYARTRHNVGSLYVRSVAKAWGVRLKKSSFSSKSQWTDRCGKRILLATPQTYMNNSGLAVRQIVASGGIALENLVIVYDDLDIPLGDIRIRKEGSSGTHRGMRSIVQELGSILFPRIRVGIGPLPPDVDATDFVLSSFSDEEKPLLEQSLRKAKKALDLILHEQIDAAMNLYNQRTRSDKDG